MTSTPVLSHTPSDSDQLLLLRTWRETAGPITVLLDPAVAVDGRPPMWSGLDRLDDRDRVELVTRPWDAAEITRLARSHSRAVAAVGGGAAMDAAKLTAVLATSPELADRLLRPGRGGAICLPPHVRRPPLALVATTVGTGSEASATACMLGVGADDASRRLIVVGDALRPDLGLRLDAATADLPLLAVRLGVLEVMFRLVGSVIGSPALDPVAALRPLPTLVAFAQALEHGSLSPAQRRTLAELSAATHARPMPGANSFGHLTWYVANEVSSALGTAKIPTTAALLPSVWRRIEDGDARWGDPENLRAVWRVVAECTEAAVDEPASQGLARLAARWGAEPALADVAADPTALARRVVRAWGAGLPMLGNLRVTDVADVLRDALTNVGARVEVAA